MSPRLRTFVVCLALPLGIGACARWRVQGPTPGEAIRRERPSKARVTMESGDQLVLRRPRVVTGVLRGFEDTCVSFYGMHEEQCPERGFPLSDVTVVEVRKRPLVAFILPGVVLMSAMYYLIQSFNPG